MLMTLAHDDIKTYKWLTILEILSQKGRYYRARAKNIMCAFINGNMFLASKQNKFHCYLIFRVYKK